MITDGSRLESSTNMHWCGLCDPGGNGALAAQALRYALMFRTRLTRNDPGAPTSAGNGQTTRHSLLARSKLTFVPRSIGLQEAAVDSESCDPQFAMLNLARNDCFCGSEIPAGRVGFAKNWFWCSTLLASGVWFVSYGALRGG